MTRKVSVIIEKDESGYFAYVPELPGCHSQGETHAEVMKNIQEAIDLYLDVLSPEERLQLTSQQIESTTLEVEIG